jgi:hypothetical protein
MVGETIVDFSDVFEFGATIEFIRQSDLASYEVKGKGWLVEMLYAAMGFFSMCKIDDKIIFDNIAEWIARLEKNYRKGQKISKKDGKELSDDADHWQTLISKELCARPCIEFERGALNQKALVDTSEGKPSSIFEKKVWNEIPKIAQSDFSDAAKCLLAGAATPATMVGLRGIEAVIREYYILKTSKPAEKEDLFDIIKKLEQMPQINKKLLGYIDYIRAEKRNIAQHPNNVFTQREAERTFMEIVCATHDIYADLPSSKKK